MGGSTSGWGSNIQQGTGGGKKGQGQGQAAGAPPTVAAPPVSQNAPQQLSSAEQQFANSPWGPWQSNVNAISQGLQAQYLGEGSTASQSSESNDMLAQWLFGGNASGEGTT